MAKIPSPKSWGFTLALILTFALSCTHPHATAAEKAILPDPATEKYWLYNHVVQDKAGFDVHECVLLTQSPSDQGSGISCFVSRWNGRDSTYSYGMQASPSGVWSRSAKWPMVARILGDSTTQEWRWIWGRKSFWLEGQFSYPATAPMTIKTNFFMRLPLSLDTLQADPIIVVPTIFSSGDAQAKSPSKPVHFSIFQAASSLLQGPSTKAIYWIDLAGKADDPDRRLLCLRLSTNNELTSLIDAYFDDGAWQKSQHFDWHLRDLAKWQSPHSHKEYMLGLNEKVNDRVRHLRPRSQDQELRAGRNSFWMGAVELVGAAGEQHATGNMYIFQH